MNEEMGEELAPNLSPEDVKKGLEIVEQYGFDCICGSSKLEATWDEDTGAINYRETGNFAEAFKSSAFVDLTIPKPADIAAMFSNEEGEEQFEEAFKQDFEFRSFEMTLSDTGGLTDLFEMLHAIGEAFPEQEGMAILTYNDAGQLRDLAVNSINGMKPMVRQEVPGADPFMDAVASFLEEGGTLNLSVKPPRPITAALIEEMDETYGAQEPEPEQIIEIFGISVTHTK